MSAEYDTRMITMLELIWGRGFMAPGGAAYVREHLAGLDLKGKTVLDVGSGLGGGALVIAGDFGAKVIGLDVEPAVVDRARGYAEEAKLADRVDFRVVEPGPFPLPDEAVDLVYSSGVFAQIDEKEAAFAECFRVLKPGGRLVVYDWMKPDGPPSKDMLYFYKVEGLTYAMRSPQAHVDLLTSAGFVDVELEDCSEWYRRQAREEWEQMKGPLYPKMLDLLGKQWADEFVEDWRAMLVVLDSGELLSGRYRGRKPESG